MAKFIYSQERGCMVDKVTGEPMNKPGPWKPVMPMVIPDTAGYQSPIDGQWVEGRRARRYDLEKNNCVEAGDLPRVKHLKNERFAKKHGVEHLLER